MLCDDLEGWEGGVGGRLKKGGDIHVFLQLIHFVAQQTLTQCCKAITKKKKRKTTMKAECEDLAMALLQRVRKRVQLKITGSLDAWETAVQLRTRKSEGGEFALRRFCLWDMGNVGSQDSQQIISNTELALRAREDWKVIHIHTQLEALECRERGRAWKTREESQRQEGEGNSHTRRGRRDRN